MADPRFYVRAGPIALSELAALTMSALAPGAPAGFLVHDVDSLEAVQTGEIAYAQTARLAAAAVRNPGIALIVPPATSVGGLPPALLLNANPARAFAQIGAAFYPAASQPQFRPGVAIDPSSKIGSDVQLGAGVAVGEAAEIGDGTRVAPNTVIGPGVAIGRGCSIGANTTIAYALIGDRVIIHPGSAIGQDGFGFIGSSRGHLKIPQLGRVIIQDDVEIGACCTIDRGALADTVIGEGTKIDNMVHIAHNCRVGRHVVIAGMVGLSGSVTLEDFVMIAGQAGVSDHLTIGKGARIAARGAVLHDVPAGSTYGGFPAKPRMQWLREVAWVERTMTKEKDAARGKAKPVDSEET